MGSPFIYLTIWGEIPLVGGACNEAGGRAQVGSVRQVLRPLNRIQGAAGTLSLHMPQLVVLELNQRVQRGRLALPALAFRIEGEVFAGNFVGINIVLLAEFLK